MLGTSRNALMWFSIGHQRTSSTGFPLIRYAYAIRSAAGSGPLRSLNHVSGNEQLDHHDMAKDLIDAIENMKRRSSRRQSYVAGLYPTSPVNDFSNYRKRQIPLATTAITDDITKKKT